MQPNNGPNPNSSTTNDETTTTMNRMMSPYRQTDPRAPPTSAPPKERKKAVEIKITPSPSSPCAIGHRRRIFDSVYHTTMVTNSVAPTEDAAPKISGEIAVATAVVALRHSSSSSSRRDKNEPMAVEAPQASPFAPNPRVAVSNEIRII